MPQRGQHAQYEGDAEGLQQVWLGQTSGYCENTASIRGAEQQLTRMVEAFELDKGPEGAFSWAKNVRSFPADRNISARSRRTCGCVLQMQMQAK